MYRSDATRLVLSLIVSLFLGESLSAQVVPDRDVSQIRIAGLNVISPQTIRRRLACLPEIVEASHSSVDHQTYTLRIRDAVARGMLASGFFASRVELTGEVGSLTLTIQEGPRFQCGSITVEGATKEVDGWIGSQLLAASTDTEDAKPVWQLGKPANGTSIGQRRWRQEIQQRLTEIGLQGEGAVVDLVRNDDARTLDLHLTLSAADARFEVPRPVDSNDPASESTNQESDNPTSGESCLRELREIHRRLFSSPMSGVRIRGSDDTWAADLVVGSTTVIAMIDHESHRRTVAIERGEVLISMDHPPAAIRFPIPNASVILYMESAEEAAGKTMRIVIDGSFSSEEPETSVRAGIVFTEQAWAEWFPPGSTERFEDQQGVTYTHESRCLRMDRHGDLLELSGTDSIGLRIAVNRIEELEIRKLSDEIVQASNPVELFVRDQETGRQISLAEIFRTIVKSNENDVHFHIPPAGGERDVYGVLLLTLVHDGAFGELDSLPAQLATLCALEMSGNRRGLGERLAEIEPESLQGPISSAVVATLCVGQGNAERALKHFRRAQQFVGEPEAIERDLKLLLDADNLLGRVCRQVDVKRWIQQSTLLAEPFVEAPQLMQSIQVLTSSFPDAGTNQERCDNAKRLMSLAYELVVQEALEEYLAGMIHVLESHQEAIAEQQASDEKKR